MAKKEKYTDELLLKSLVSGNEKAFQSLFDVYQKDVFSYSFSLLKSETYMEDFTMD